MEKMDFWVSLESNPEALTKFAHKIGVPEDWVVNDVFGFDPELLDMVPKPVAALILLYPVGILRPDVSGDTVSPSDQPKVFFLTQNIFNACGTIAIIHAVANSPIEVDKDSVIGSVIHGGENKSPTERGTCLENIEKLKEAHRETANEGQTAAPSPTTTTCLHFVALVHREGRLWELDGTRSGLVDHGPSSEDTFLTDAAVVCRRIVEANPEENRFSVLAITARPASETG